MRRNYSRSIPAQWRATTRVFSALGDEHRQRIVLTFEAGERLTVGDIAGISTLSRPTVSHHLKLLRQAGVLRSEKIGRKVWFWINRPFLDDVLASVVRYIRAHC